MTVAAKNLILSEIADERRRQDQLLYEGKIKYDCADPQTAWGAKLAVLGEEFGEVCRAICEGDSESMRAELIQLAAVSVAILESLE